MRPITVIRAVQFASVIVTAWSSAMPWGDELGIGKGPPSQFERQLVGAALLLLLGAVAMVLTARNGAKPGRFALGVAGISSIGAIALTLSVRSAAIANEQGHVLLGGGWLWMAGGACLALGATGSALALSLNKAPDSVGPAKVATNPTRAVANAGKAGTRSGSSSAKGSKKKRR